MFTPEQMLEIVPRITAQWLAGFFDGEGCVSSSKRGVMYGVKVSISQSDPVLLMAIATRFTRCTFVTSVSRLSSKPAYALVWTGRSCLELLEFIKEYVIVKKVQVEAGIEIAKFLSKRTINGKGGPAFTQAEADERERLANIICEAKR